MAQYFAQIDENKIVTRVAVVTREFLESNPSRYPGRWVETFFDTAGKQYAGVGMKYLENEQDFQDVKPFASWTWANKTWNAPTPYPSGGGSYRWNEAELEWVAI